MKTMIIMKATLMNRKLFKKSIYYRVSRSLCRVVPCFWHCCYYLQILKGSMIFRMRDFSKQIQHSIFEKQNTRTDKLHSWKAVSIATFEHRVDGLATKKKENNFKYGGSPNVQCIVQGLSDNIEHFYRTCSFQFPSTRCNQTVPASPPTAASTALPTAQPADYSGYEPNLHPDQLPASVPGQGSLLHQLTKKKPTSRSRRKSASIHGATMKSTSKPKVNVKTGLGPDKPSKTKVPPKRNKQASTAMPDISTFGVEICNLVIPAIHMDIVVGSLDYVKLRHSAYLSNIIVDFANSWSYQQAALNIGDSVHLFPACFYVSLVALQRARKGSAAEASELAEGLPLPERRHGRVARWTRNTHLFDKDMVLFPICLDNGRSDGEKHWLLVVALLGQDPVVVVLDSLGGARQDQLTEIKEYMEVEARVKGREVPGFRVLRAQVPQQHDGFNCGIFVIMYISRIMADHRAFAARARLDQLGDWFLPSAVSGQRSHWAEVIRKLGTRQAPRRARRFPNLDFEPPTNVSHLGCMINLDRCCFVVAAFLLLCQCEVDKNLLPNAAQSQAQIRLSTVLSTMASRRRDPTVPPMDPEAFIQAVNALGQRQFRYDAQVEDSCELLETAVENLSLRPGYLVVVSEKGTCNRCNNLQQQVAATLAF